MTFYSVPNDYVLSGSFLLGLIVTLAIIRFIYFLSDLNISSSSSKSSKSSDKVGIGAGGYTRDVYLPVLGLKAYRVLSVLSLLPVALLGSRVPYTYDSSKQSFWSLDSINKSWWVVIRMLSTAMNVLIAQVFDSNPILRWFSLLTLPMIYALELLSEASFHSTTKCVDDGICIMSDAEYSSYYLWLWRDLIGAATIQMLFIFSCWLVALTGVWKNTLFIPREEHRKMIQKIERIYRNNLKAKEKLQKSGVATTETGFARAAAGKEM